MHGKVTAYSNTKNIASHYDDANAKNADHNLKVATFPLLHNKYTTI